MGLMTDLAAFSSFLTVLLVVGTTVVGGALAMLAIGWFDTQRTLRQARRESILTYYLRGHFAHTHAYTH